jgi:hypothetical protein
MVTDKGRLGVMGKRFELYGGVKGFGVLRFAQDDSNSNCNDNSNSKDKSKGNGRGDMSPGRDITRRRG